jgi:hypothetical protein
LHDFSAYCVSINVGVHKLNNSITVEATENALAVQEDQLQQNQSQDVAPESFKISVEASLVATDITIIGPETPQLSADDFIVLDNGAQELVTHFSRNELPLAAALLIDTSLTVQDYLCSDPDRCEKLSSQSGSRRSSCIVFLRCHSAAAV